MKATTTCPQTKMGMRFSDMPGARSLKTVTMISTATASAETSVNVISCAQKSGAYRGRSRALPAERKRTSRGLRRYCTRTRRRT